MIYLLVSATIALNKSSFLTSHQVNLNLKETKFWQKKEKENEFVKTSDSTGTLTTFDNTVTEKCIIEYHERWDVAKHLTVISCPQNKYIAQVTDNKDGTKKFEKEIRCRNITRNGLRGKGGRLWFDPNRLLYKITYSEKSPSDEVTQSYEYKYKGAAADYAKLSNAIEKCKNQDIEAVCRAIVSAEECMDNPSCKCEDNPSCEPAHGNNIECRASHE